MNDPRYQKLLEASWRRKLTAAEKAELDAWLKAHPEAQAEWQFEARLSRALRQLPDRPVATNFTTRVLRAIEAEHRESRWAWPWRLAWLRVGFATVLVAGVGFFTYQQQVNSRRAELGHSLETFSSFEIVPSPDALLNYAPISQMGAVAPDPELFTLGLTTP